ncbi:MAG: alanine racemase, partial [[Clostridium] symbiosum]|nr:alanine racemase [[Clostridium] symbiosum]
MTDTILQEAAKQYKTPFYLFDSDELIQNVERIRKLSGEDINICYAMKANPFLVAALADQVNRIEACSVGEYDLCRNQGIKPEKIILSGVLKKKEELERIFRKEMTLPVVTAESKEQFFLMSELAQKYEKNIRILLRLTSGNQFGMELSLVEELLIESLNHPYLKIAGLHYFSGTQKTDVSLMTHELLYLNG